MTRRTLWLHSWTDKAFLLSPGSLSHKADQEGEWFPLSMITIVKRWDVPSPSGQAVMGTAVTFDAPDWLLAKKGIMADAEIPTTEGPDHD